MERPKNDKARKAWLAGLNDGNEAAWLDGDTYRIGIIKRDVEESEIRLVCGGLAVGWFTTATGKGVHVERTIGWLIPVTAEIKAKVAHRAKVHGLRRVLSGRCFYVEFTDDQILAVTAILWPEVVKK
jgi:hypothetical protein